MSARTDGRVVTRTYAAIALVGPPSRRRMTTSLRAAKCVLRDLDLDAVGFAVAVHVGCHDVFEFVIRIIWEPTTLPFS